MRGPLALVSPDPDGGFDVRNTRSGRSLAWRGDLGSANEVAVAINSTYPSGSVAPAHDSLVHEIVGLRITGERPEPLHVWAHDEVNLCGLIPAGVSDDPDELWKPRVGS